MPLVAVILMRSATRPRPLHIADEGIPRAAKQYLRIMPLRYTNPTTVTPGINFSMTMRTKVGHVSRCSRSIILAQTDLLP